MTLKEESTVLKRHFNSVNNVKAIESMKYSREDMFIFYLLNTVDKIEALKVNIFMWVTSRGSWK